MKPSTRPKIQLKHNLTEKLVKLALNDLKDKHAGVLLSANTLKILLLEFLYLKLVFKF